MQRVGGEVVCGMGSSLFPSNASTMKTCDVSVAVNPNLFMSQKSRRAVEAVRVSCAMNALPAAFVIDHDVSRYVLADIVAEGRRLLRNSQQATLCIFALHGMMGLVLMLESLLTIPAILPTAHIVWLIYVQMPLVTLPLMCVRSDEAVMKAMPPKTNDSVLSKRRAMSRYARYALARIAPSAVAVVIVFMNVLNARGNRSWSSMVWASSKQPCISRLRLQRREKRQHSSLCGRLL